VCVLSFTTPLEAIEERTGRFFLRPDSSEAHEGRQTKISSADPGLPLSSVVLPSDNFDSLEGTHPPIAVCAVILCAVILYPQKKSPPPPLWWLVSALTSDPPVP
jgi:hypothetical protein